VNHAAQTEFARASRRKSAARRVAETAADDGRGGFRLHAGSAPGAFIFCGNGNSAGLHHPAYNFNDEAIVYGTSLLDQAGGEFAGGVSGETLRTSLHSSRCRTI
jgi:hippurate hydrolase